MKSKNILSWIAQIVFAACLPGLYQVQAGSAQFTIDPGRSNATLSGVAAGLAVQEQGPGSLTTSFAGHLLVDLEENAISFPGGSVIDAITNGNWSPKAFGDSGTEPADFGAAASGGLLSGTAALREVMLDLESEGPLPLINGEFSADGLLFVFPEAAPSAFDYRITMFIITEKDRRLLAGYATNQIATVGSFQTEGNMQTLTIPVEATLVFELLEPADSTLTIQGQLVATRTLDIRPAPQIVAVRLEQGELVFEWDAEPDAIFEIQETTDLTNWIRAAELPGGTSQWRVPVAEGIAFFRVVRR